MNNIFDDTTTGIGNHTNAAIVNKLYSSKPDHLIRENLKAIIPDFLPIPALIQIGARNIFYDNKIKDSPTSQFQIEIGNNEQHEMDNDNQNKKIGGTGTFLEKLKIFYCSLFSPREKISIEQALNDGILYHVVIYCYYYERKRSESTTKTNMNREMVAAASFRTAKMSSILVYFGVSNLPVLQNDDINCRIKKKGNSYRQQHFGTLCLCTVQKITKLLSNTYNVVCETNHEKDNRTNKFYHKLYFKDLSFNNKLIQEHIKLSEISFHDEVELTTMVSCSPIYLLHPISLQYSTTTLELTTKIIKGSQYILQLNKKKLFNNINEEDMYGMITLIESFFEESKFDINNDGSDVQNGDLASVEVLMYLFSQEEPFKNFIIHDVTTFIFEKKSVGVNKNETNDISDDSNNASDSEEDGEISNDKDDSNIKEIKNTYIDDENIYKLISFILFGSPKFYMDVRIFIYYTLQCISYMSRSADIYKFTNTSEIFNNCNKDFYSDFLDKLRTFHIYYDSKVLKDMKIVDELENIDINHMTYTFAHMFIPLLSNCVLDYGQFAGSIFELKIIASIFNIEFNVIKLICKLDDTNVKKWFYTNKKLKEYPCLCVNDSIFDRKTIILYCDENNKYHVIGQKQNFQYTDYDYYVMKWLNDKKHKTDFIKLNSENNHLIIRENFTIDQFYNDHINKKHIYILVKLLDPLYIWYQKKLFLIGNGLTVVDILTLRPTTWVAVTMMEAFIKIIVVPKKNHILFMYPSLYNMFINNKTVRDTIIAKFNDDHYDYIACLVLVNKNHWIIIESKINLKTKGQITLQYADSLDYDELDLSTIENNFDTVVYTLFVENSFLDNEGTNIRTKCKDFMKKFTKHFIYEKNNYCEKQENSYDCGVHCCYRLFYMTFENGAINYFNNKTGTTDITIFRLYMLSLLIFESVCHKVLMTKIEFKDEDENIDGNQNNHIEYNTSDDDFTDIESSVNDLDDAFTVGPELDQLNQIYKDPNNINNNENQSFDSDEDASSTMEYSESEDSHKSIINSPSRNNNKKSSNISDEQDDETKSMNSSVNKLRLHIEKDKIKQVNLNINNIKDKKTNNDIRTTKASSKRKIMNDMDEKQTSLSKKLKKTIINSKPQSKVINTKEKQNHAKGKKITPKQPKHQFNHEYPRKRLPPIEMQARQRAGGKQLPVVVLTAEQIERENSKALALANLAEYDEDKQFPDDISFEAIPNDLETQLIENRKNSISRSLRKNWKVNAFDESQQSTAKAKLAINTYLQGKLRVARTQKDEYFSLMEIKVDEMNELDAEDKIEYKRLNNQLKALRSQYVRYYVEVDSIKYDLENKPYFHPRDNIIALTKKNRKRPGQDGQYLALIKLDDDHSIMKEISYEWLKENVDEQFLSHFEIFNTEKGWICMKDGGDLITFENTDEINHFKTTLKPIYEFKDPVDGILIKSIKLELQFELKFKEVNGVEEEDPTFKEVNYYVNLDEKEKDNLYESITEVELKKICRDEYINNIYLRKLALSFREFKNKGILRNSRQFIDPLDNFDESIIGNIEHVQTHYYTCRNKGFKFVKSKKQISKIKYMQATNRWVGIENENCHESNNFTKTVLLTENWINENFDEEKIQFLKDMSIKNNNKFLSVPIGDIIQVKPTMTISHNPIIKYKNNESGICAYASLASALHYLQYFELAEIIIDLSKQDYPDFDKYHGEGNLLQSLNIFILKNKKFNKFRKIYKNVKLNKKCTILDLSIKKDELCIINIIQSDNHQSHAICICNRYIFDSNADFALPFTKEGLDCCCGEKEEFIGIVHGYHFAKR